MNIKRKTDLRSIRIALEILSNALLLTMTSRKWSFSKENHLNQNPIKLKQNQLPDQAIVAVPPKIEHTKKDQFSQKKLHSDACMLPMTRVANW